MAKRKPMTKTTRFEVFKRDSFTCQYCGQAAPAVILQVDHIQPVSKDGEDDVLNLITSCFDCNMGKSDRLLSDNTAVLKQKAQLDELQERRDQLDMMLEWREGLKDIRESEIDIAVEAFDAIQPGWVVNEAGRHTLAKHVKKFGLQTVLNAIDKANDQYIEIDSTGEVTTESGDIAFSKLGGICRLSAQPDWKRELYYLRGILRKRLGYVNDQDAIRYMTDAYESGVSLEELKDIACNCSRNWSSWVFDVDNARERANGETP